MVNHVQEYLVVHISLIINISGSYVSLENDD